MLKVLEDELNLRLDKGIGTFSSEFMHVEHFTDGAEQSTTGKAPMGKYIFSNNGEFYHFKCKGP